MAVANLQNFNPFLTEYLHTNEMMIEIYQKYTKNPKWVLFAFYICIIQFQSSLFISNSPPEGPQFMTLERKIFIYYIYFSDYLFEIMEDVFKFEGSSINENHPKIHRFLLTLASTELIDKMIE